MPPKPPKLYDVKAKKDSFEAVLPLLKEMAENDGIEMASITVVKRDGSTVNMFYGMDRPVDALTGIGGLEAAKAQLLARILELSGGIG